MPIKDDVVLGADVVIHQPELVNLYGCRIGDGTRIGTFVEIQADVVIGKNCKIQSHTFICSAVTIEDDVFIGHGVMFTNDKHPRAVNAKGTPQSAADWSCLPTLVKRGASIGTHATILPGVTIHEGALVAAGAVVTRDVAPNTVVTGLPARSVGPVPDQGPTAEIRRRSELA